MGISIVQSSGVEDSVSIPLPGRPVGFSLETRTIYRIPWEIGEFFAFMI